jgi:hypothetical protein
MIRWQFAIPLTFTLAAAACVQKAAPKPEPEPFVGAWRSSLQFDNGAFAEIKDLEFMYAFNAGGTMTESSNYDGAPPVPPAYGVWRKTGPSEYELKYEYYSTAPAEEPAFLKGAGWLPSGRGVFTETIKLAADGKTFTSAMRYEAFDAKGNAAEVGGTANGHAVRIGF